MLTNEELWEFWWNRPEVADGEDDSMEAEFVAAARAIEAAVLAKQKEAQQEPVGEVQHLHELNDAWLAKLPIGTKLYASQTMPTGLLRQCLEALDLSRDDVSDCLCDAQVKAGYQRYDRRIEAYQEQLVKHDAAIAAIREVLE